MATFHIKRQAQPKETPSVAFFFCPLYCASGPLRTMAKHVDLCILDSSCWDFSSTLTFAMCLTSYHLLSDVSGGLTFADGLWATICFFLLGSGETKKEASYHKNLRTNHDVPKHAVKSKQTRCKLTTIGKWNLLAHCSPPRYAEFQVSGTNILWFFSQ